MDLLKPPEEKTWSRISGESRGKTSSKERDWTKDGKKQKIPRLRKIIFFGI
jgi:hypothetical protein